MSGVRLLHPVNRQSANGIDASLVDVLLGRNRCCAHDSSCAGWRAPAGKSGFRCTGGTRRVGEFYVNLVWIAEFCESFRKALIGKLLFDRDALYPRIVVVARSIARTQRRRRRR